MIAGKTASGFSYQLEEEAIDNMELVDALVESGDNPLAVSRACLLLLGKDTRQRLYEHLRTKDGRVPVAEVSSEMVEIFKAFGDKGKNC